MSDHPDRDHLAALIASAYEDDAEVQVWDYDAADAVLSQGYRRPPSDTFEDLTRILAETYTDEGVAVWLSSPNRNLDGERPLDLIVRGDLSAVMVEARSLEGKPLPDDPAREPSFGSVDSMSGTSKTAQSPASQPATPTEESIDG